MSFVQDPVELERAAVIEMRFRMRRRSRDHDLNHLLNEFREDFPSLWSHLSAFLEGETRYSTVRDFQFRLNRHQEYLDQILTRRQELQRCADGLDRFQRALQRSIRARDNGAVEVEGSEIGRARGDAEISSYGRMVTPFEIEVLFSKVRACKSSEACAICLEKNEQTDCVKLPQCNHTFHSHCVRGWIEAKGACPLCRTGV